MLVAYFVVVLTVTALAYAEKVARHETKAQAEKSLEKVIQKNDDPVAALKSCNFQYYQKLKKEDFEYLQRSEILDSVWETFFSSGADTPECYKILSLLAAHNIQSNYLYSVHNMIFNGNEKGLRKSSLAESFLILF